MEYITNTQGFNYFKDMNTEGANVVVVLGFAHPQDIVFLKVDEHEDVEAAVRRCLADTTFGGNFRFKIVKVIGTTYFCDPEPRY